MKTPLEIRVFSFARRLELELFTALPRKAFSVIFSNRPRRVLSAPKSDKSDMESSKKYRIVQLL